MEGRRAQLPVSGWGASSLHCVCPPFPGAPHPGEGPCMSGGPLPLPKPLSVSVSLCCLYKTWRPNPCSHRECQQTNPSCSPRHTHSCVYPFCSPHPLSGQSPHCCCYECRNKHIPWVSLRLGLLSFLGPGSWVGTSWLCIQTNVSFTAWVTFGNLIDLSEPF